MWMNDHSDSRANYQKLREKKPKSVQKAVKWTQLKMDFFKLFAKVSYSDSLQPLMSLHQAVKA